MSQLNVDTITNAAGSGGQLSLSNGDFNFDSNTVFVDVSEDRVGIGTSSPTAALDVRGSGGVILHSAPLIEKTNVIAGVINDTTNVDVLTSGVWMWTNAGTGNWSHNLRGNATTTFNAGMENGQATVITIISALGTSSGYASGLSIDGTAQTIEWTGGEAPTERGGDTGFDIYSFTIVKTANATFTVFGSYQLFD